MVYEMLSWIPIGLVQILFKKTVFYMSAVSKNVYS